MDKIINFMREDSLFRQLFKYRPTDNIYPLENFITEIFAFLLENSSKFRKNILSDFLPSEKYSLFSSPCYIETQSYKMNYGILDILIKLGEFYIVIENKVNSDFHENQLINYLSFINLECNGNGVVVALTKYQYSEEDRIKDVIYKDWIWLSNKYLSESAILSYEESLSGIFKSFNLFLKENDMNLDKVGWELAFGIENELRMANLLYKVCADLSTELKINISNLAKDHFAVFGFYCSINITEKKYLKQTFSIWYVLEHKAIYIEINKKYLNSEHGFIDLFWDGANQACINKFEITKLHFLGLEFNDQYNILKEWVKKTINKARENYKSV